MKAYTFPVPSKKTEDVSWTKPLNNYLLSIYGNTTEFQQDLNNFEKLRQDIRGVHADNTGIKLYYKYYSQLELLDLRVSFQTVNRHKKLSFTWYDAFQTSISHKQTALPFEKACVLFNIGSFLSKFACTKYEESQRNESSQATDETIKESLQYFQQAAGIYQFLSENFLHAPSNDLNQNTVCFLVKLMLAQGQEVFVLKAISGDLEQKKNSLISKLCLGASNHYSECYKLVSNITESGTSTGSSHDEFAVIDTSDGVDDILGGDDEEVENEYNPANSDESYATAKIDSMWVATISFKIKFYESLSYYFQGLQLENNNKYGESIAYLTKSLSILKDIPSSTLKSISKSGSNDALELLDNYKYQKDVAGIKLVDLTKDNDFIYHDIIPSLVTLPEVKPMDGVKIITINNNKLFNEINEYNYGNFLNNVVPINIHELLSFYSEEKSQLLRNELDLVDVSNEELSSVLEYLKLPKALVNLKELINSNNELDSFSSQPEGNINLQVKIIANEISTNYKRDISNKESIVSLRKEIYNTINESESAIAGQYAEPLIKYKDDLVRLKKSLIDASNSDKKLFALINNDNSHLYGVLGKGSESPELQSFFSVDTSNPKNESVENEVSLLDLDDSELSKQSNQAGSIDGKIKEIEHILYDLNSIKTNKTKLIETLKKEIHNDDISDILILNSKIKSSNEIKTVIFAEELKKFEPYSTELDKLIQQQKEFIGNLEDRWAKLSQDPKAKEIQSSKRFQQDLVKHQTDKITKFHLENWRKYNMGLNAGVEFYTKLLNYARLLHQNISATASSSSHRPSFNQSFSNMSVGLGPPTPQNYIGADMISHESHGSLDRSSTGGSLGSYSRPPPALPPKRPSQSAQPPPQNHQSQQAPNFSANQNSKNGDLIYNQPSKYQPNMYNFFSSN